MPLSQRHQHSDRKGMGLVRLGGVLCLAAVLFGSICMTIVATMGDGEDPPKIFEQMGGASCGVFALGLILGLVGGLIWLNQPDPPKPTASRTTSAEVHDEDTEGAPDDVTSQDALSETDANKPDPYKADHRRRGY